MSRKEDRNKNDGVGNHNLVLKQDPTLSELNKIIDSYSISLNAPNEERYYQLVRPPYEHAFEDYRDFPYWVKEILEFEENKFLNPHERYAWKIRDMYTGNYVKKGLQLAKKLQEVAISIG